MRKARLLILFVTFFATADAGLCPALCLAEESEQHESSNQPAPNVPSTACGACAVGLFVAVAPPPNSSTPVAIAVVEHPAELVPLDRAFDIDHPPRLS